MKYVFRRMGSLIADLRHALRMMRRSPGFAAVAVAALALGIGANTGIFSVIDKVLLEPLPYPDAGRIMRLGRKFPQMGIMYSNSIPKYMVWRHNDVFSAMALYDGGVGFNVSTGDRPQQVKGMHASKDYFKVFGIMPLLGRTFTAQEDSPNGPKAAIISYSLWKSHFGGDPHILGKTIVLNEEPYPIVGIMPANFIPDTPTDVWTPLQADPNSRNQGHYLAAAARLKPGVSIGQARAEMKLAGERFRRLYPRNMDKNESVAVTPMRDSLVRNVKPALFVLLGAVGLVLLIACANVANLLLARAAARQKELAIRAAVGASRSRVMRQLLTESVLLAGAGGIAGFVLGALGVRILLALVPGDIPRLTDPSQAQNVLSLLDWRVAAFTVGVSFFTGILFGLFPALQISNPDLASALKEASGRSASGRHQNRMKKMLVASEMALALVLLVSAVLLIRTFAGLSSVNPGIDPHHVLTMQTSLAGERYASTAKVDNFTTQALRRIESLPGVHDAAVAVILPTTSETDLPFTIAGKPPKGGQIFNGDEQWRSVSPHYFGVFKIPLLSGRLFNEHDLENSAPVVLINRAMARKYWPKENPVGQVITIGQGLGPQFKDPPRQIVGIVGDVRETGLADQNVSVMYIPQSQVPDGFTQLLNDAIPLSWCIRSTTSGTALTAAVQHAIQSVDAQMPISQVRTMDQILSGETDRQDFNMLLLSIFAGIALLLAAIGIYGLMSYSVEQQTQELGIRMALGADRPDLLRLILKRGLKPAIVGIVAGLAIAFGATRLLSSLLYGVKPTDPATFAIAAVVLLAIALASTYIPARRAMRLDPFVALRNE